MIRTCAPLTGCWFDLSVTWPATLPCWAALARATPTSNAPNPRNASSVRRLELCIDPLFEGALERMTQESRPRRGLAAGRISCCDERMPHPCPTAWANTDGAMWHARYVLERALHMGIIVRRELETRKSLTQARFREIRARVGRCCQETVMTVQPVPSETADRRGQRGSDEWRRRGDQRVTGTGGWRRWATLPHRCSGRRDRGRSSTPRRPSSRRAGARVSGPSRT